MSIKLTPINPNSGAYQAGLQFESETQSDGSERPVVKLGSVTSTNIHTSNEELRVFSAGHVCTQNSTSTPLAGNATFTGGWQDTLDYSEVIVSVYSDKVSATDGLVIEWSSNGVTADENDVFTVPAGNGKTWSFPCNRRFVRVVYTNGATAQTVFGMQTLLKRFASKGSSHRLADSLNGQDDAIVTKSLVAGKTTAGSGAIVDVKVNPSGALTVESTTPAITDGSAKTQITDPDGDIAQVIAGANTGVKGLRVYGGPTDPISDVPVVIEFDHHQIHEGEAWKWNFFGAVNAATKDVRFSVPVLAPTTRTPHFLMELISDNTSATIYLYEGTTWTAVGTDDSARIFNRNRNVAGSPNSKIYVSGATALTPNALGTLLEVGYVFTGKGAMSSERSTMEWDLRANTEYLIRVVTVGNGTVLLRLNFYEDQGV